MPSYVVKEREPAEVWTSAQGGQMQAWNLKLWNEQGEYECSANTKVGNEFPAIGETVEGELTSQGPKGMKFKKAWRSTPEGSRRSPQETASIVRQHSQTVAVYWAAVLQKASPDIKPSYTWLKEIVDWFDQDAKGAS